MSQTLEIEFKTLLTQTDYQKLVVAYFQQDRIPFVQTNYYYDTPNFDLKEYGAGLRIRQLNDRAELTLKTPLKNQYGLLETNDDLPLDDISTFIKSPVSWPHEHVIKKLNSFAIYANELELKAQLKTSRLEINLSPDVLLVLDESWYHGKHDYELEMEVTDATIGKEFFLNFLKEHNIQLVSTKNKIARAVAENTDK
ncbi:CYTH domain-containing protein [Vagococcus coleopterorum]|uniref:CYTH domain-containing protein n=1 Tax=Vagococcus coleopterorum TaxID=2714946 RepID=A0A6G8AL75_9ENTE|nr:CYTH domain-containing protein [Vagococcus coleopterorum]QIL45730.1 CYTH domain-containing protein [Vagococcus coleopterorum]